MISHPPKSGPEASNRRLVLREYISRVIRTTVFITSANINVGQVSSEVTLITISRARRLKFRGLPQSHKETPGECLRTAAITLSDDTQRAGWCDGNAVSLFSRGTWFISRLGYPIS